MWTLLIAVALLPSSLLAQDCSQASASVSGGNLVLKYQAYSGLQEVGFHFSVNRDVSGSGATDNNYEVTSQSGGVFTLQTSTPASQGDSVGLWLYLLVNGQGTVVTDCRLTVGSGGGSQPGSQSGSQSTSSPNNQPNNNGGGSGSCGGNRRLVWSDEFDGPNIDLAKWKHEVSAFGGGNWEFQTYTPDPENSYIKNGALYIRPTLLADKFGADFVNNGVLDVNALWGTCTNSMWYGCLRDSADAPLPPCLSAKLISRYSFKYGRMEVEAKMPVGDWLWPTIWLWPKDDEYGSWPRSGEIDLVETRGNRHYGNIGINRIMSTLHYGPVNGEGFQDGWGRSTAEKFSSGGSTWADDFHTYFIDWCPEHIQLGVDNEVILNFPTPSNSYWGYGGFTGTNPWTNGGHDAPFDKEFVIQLNVAVGGTLGFFPDGLDNEGYPKPWCNSCPTAGMSNRVFWEHKDQWYPTWRGETCAMQVRSVRVYQ